MYIVVNKICFPLIKALTINILQANTISVYKKVCRVFNVNKSIIEIVCCCWLHQFRVKYEVLRKNNGGLVYCSRRPKMSRTQVGPYWVNYFAHARTINIPRAEVTFHCDKICKHYNYLTTILAFQRISGVNIEKTIARKDVT